MAAVLAPQNSTTVRKSSPSLLSLALLRVRFALGGWLMPETTLGRAFRLFGTPLPGARARAREAGDGGARVQELPFGCERLAVYSWGDPATQPLVLLAHGWSSFGLRFLPWVQPLREAGYAVATFDQPAHGRSSGRRATLPMFAQAVHAVARHFDVPLAGLVGHSLGGAAAAVALSRGLPAGRVVLVAPAADPYDAAQRFGRMIGLAAHLSRRIFEEYEAITAFPVASMQAHHTAPRIGRPGLVVHDLEDRDVPWSEGERYARYWPQSRLFSTTGLGHHRVLNDPQVIEAALRFLQGEAVGQRVVSSQDLPFGVA